MPTLHFFAHQWFVMIATMALVATTASCSRAQNAAPAPNAPATASTNPRPETARAQIGINLNGPADWNSEIPLVDAFRLSRTWISQKQGEGWGKGPQLNLDEHGWVRSLEPNCFAESPILTIAPGRFPSGQYVLLYEGEGQLAISPPNAAKTVEGKPGRIVFDVDSSKLSGLFVQVRSTNPQNYVRNIRFILPGFEASYKENPFHPLFLNRWRGMDCLRFMDWMQTNNSKIARWNERPTLQDATWTVKGIPVEVMVDLSNRLNADAWFCMPHLADDDYVRNFAQLVKQRLNPARKIYVEYSNEVWNGQFEQSRWAGQKGQALGIGEKPWEAGWHYTAQRSVEIFNIWNEVFGEQKGAANGRLVRVLPTQAANDYVSRQIMTWKDAYKSADALAIAPYVSMNIPAQGEKLKADEVAGWSVEQIMDYVEKTALPESVQWIQKQQQAAAQYGLKLVSYEAGQHLVGIQGGENNETLTQKLQAANKTPRMGEVYRRYLTAWKENGGDLCCLFASVGTWSKWGSWGLMQFYDDRPSDYPKYAASMEIAQTWGQLATPGSLKR